MQLSFLVCGITIFLFELFVFFVAPVLRTLPSFDYTFVLLKVKSGLRSKISLFINKISKDVQNDDID
jgi:hypothetical protein